MKLLNNTLDAVSVKLDDGRVVLVKEKEVIVLGGKIMKKCKIGYEDAEIMSCALKTIFADVFEELNELRKTHTVNLFADNIGFKFKISPKDRTE
jgi:hypothetical protein